MKAILKCVHPLLPVSIAVFAVLYFALPNGIEDIFPSGQGGPCFGLPVFSLLFVPIAFCFALGIGFSAIRLLEFYAARTRTKGKIE